MAIKTIFNRSINTIKLSLLGLPIAFSLAACDQPERPASIAPDNGHSNVGIIKEKAPIDNDTFSLEELEQRLLPLQAQIKRLESELEEAHRSSVAKLEKIENKQWNVAKLNETISTLQEDKQDLQAQLKEQLSEIQVLQEALTKLDTDGKQKDIKQ